MNDYPTRLLTVHYSSRNFSLDFYRAWRRKVKLETIYHPFYGNSALRLIRPMLRDDIKALVEFSCLIWLHSMQSPSHKRSHEIFVALFLNRLTTHINTLPVSLIPLI